MIQEALKLIAEFKDNASDGIKKLQENLTGVSKEANALKPLESSKADAKIRDINREAGRAANGGLKSFFDLFSGANVGEALKGGNISVVFAGVAEQIQSSLLGPLTATAAAFTAVGAGATAAGPVVASAFRSGTASAKTFMDELEKSGQSLKDLTTVARTYRDEKNAIGRAAYAAAKAEGVSTSARRQARKAAEQAFLGEKLYQDAASKSAIVIQALSREVRGLGLKGVSGGVLKSFSTDLKTTVLSAVKAIPVFSLLAAKLVALSGAAAGLALGAIGVALNSAADDAAELAEKLGITVDRLETLKLIANETGTSIEGLQRTYDRLARVLDKTDEESDRAAISLANLGLSFEEIKALKPEEAAAKILEQYEALGKTAEATAAAQLLLGGNFRESSLGIKEAASNFDDYAGRVAKYGAGESKLLAAQGAEQEKAFNNLSLAFKGVGIQIAENIGPAITRLAQTLADLVNITRGSGVAAKITNGIFSVLNLVLNDFTRLLGGAVASLVEFFSGNFTRSWEIAKMAVEDATEAVKSFGDRSKDTAALSVQAAETAATAAEKEAEAKKLAAQAEAERLKRLAASKKAAEEQLKLFGDAKQALLQQLGLLGKETEAERLLWETQEGRYKSLTPAQKQELADLARRVDLKNKELALEEKKKQLQEGLSTQAQDLALSEEELRFTGLTSDERDRQVFLLRELNRLRTEGVGLGDVELQDMVAQVKVMADRRKALAEAARDAETINNLIDSSYGETEKRVRRSIELASKLLEDRRISEVDYVRFVKEQIGQLTAFNEEAAVEATEFWREAARGIQQSLSQFFFDFMQGKLTDLASSFKRVIDQMVANALAARLAEALFGTGFERGGQLGGFVGQAAGFLGSAFGGARAMGGPVSAGKAYLVGEKGPELAVFGQSGNVVPNNALQNMGNNVTFQITAMDSQDVLRAMSKIQREGAKLFGSASNRYNLQGV